MKESVWVIFNIVARDYPRPRESYKTHDQADERMIVMRKKHPGANLVVVECVYTDVIVPGIRALETVDGVPEYSSVDAIYCNECSCQEF